MRKRFPAPPPHRDALEPYVAANTNSTLDLVAAVLRLLAGENRHKDHKGDDDEEGE